MDKKKIIDGLSQFPQAEVEKFASYCIRISLDPKNSSWISKKTDEDMINLYKRVAADWLVFDGVHITIQSTGVSYDYVAYKNKMFIAYPESKIDVWLVYEWDSFSFSKKNGSVEYFHDIANPFGNTDDMIVGAYTIIRNKRGEFITLLSKADIIKHRQVAKTDYIWKAWFQEMCLKTIVKKACKLHFGDIFQEIEEMDNENYDLEKMNVPDWVNEIETIKTKEELKAYYAQNKGQGKEFDKAISDKMKKLWATTP